MPRTKKPSPAQTMSANTEGVKGFVQSHKTLVIGVVVAVLIIIALLLLTSQPETNKSIIPA